MRTGDIFFVVVIMIVCLFGGVIALGSQTSPVGIVDSNGNTTSATTNATAHAIQNIHQGETTYSSWFILFLAVVLVISVIVGGMMLLKKNSPNRGKYRSG